MLRFMEFCLMEIGKAIRAVGDFERYADLTVSRIQTDSRSVQPGDLFVCITGNKFDGHEFAREAVHKGATGVIVERPLDDLLQHDVPLLLVQDSIDALVDLARYSRNQFTGRVIAITGTAGKSTLKELLASVLSQSHSVGKNYQNWNNRLGVSLSILEFDCREDYWILEAGINAQNEMDTLGNLIQPDTVVINNVGPGHLEGLKDISGVAREKMRLLKYMQKQGTVVLNQDYFWLEDYFPSREDLKVVCFSSYRKIISHYKQSAGALSNLNNHKLDLDPEVLDSVGEYKPEFMLENIWALICTTLVLDANFRDLKKGLQEVQNLKHRWEIQQSGFITIIDDTYNSNPLSMQRALYSTINFSKTRFLASNIPVFVLLGDMKELGDYAKKEHIELGKLLGKLRINWVFYTGSFYKEIQKGLESETPGTGLSLVRDKKEFLAEWKEINPDKAVILAKGSRTCELEHYVEALRAELGK